MKSVLIISHGSRSPALIQEIQDLASRVGRLSAVPIVEYCFLEILSPSISQGIEACAQKGATEVVVLLNFLNAGRHIDQDIPAMLRKAQKAFPQVKIFLTKPVGQHPDIAGLFVDNISRASSADIL